MNKDLPNYKLILISEQLTIEQVIHARRNRNWQKFEKWFDLNVGWFFINGYKQKNWTQHLKEKYPEEFNKKNLSK